VRIGLIELPNTAGTSHFNSGDRGVELWMTEGFFDRFIGIFALSDCRPLLLLNCNLVHGFGMPHSLQLTFLDRDYRVVSAPRLLRPWSLAYERMASHVLESYELLPLRIGDQIVVGDIN